jgi:hypothetical protein
LKIESISLRQQVMHTDVSSWVINYVSFFCHWQFDYGK